MRLLADRFHCPRCKGRLNTITAGGIDGTPAGSLFCTVCEAIVAAPDGIPDFVGGRVVSTTDPKGLSGDPFGAEDDAAHLFEQVRVAAGSHWPDSLGDVLDLGCGGGRLTAALALNVTVRSLVGVDSAGDVLRACRDRIAQRAGSGAPAAGFVRLSLEEDALRDAVFDTVVGLDIFARVGDPRAVLDLAMRVLRPGGCAFFVVPNRRYHMACCRAVAEALVLRHAREQAWSDAARAVIRAIGLLHQRHVHHGHAAALAGLRDRNLFQPEDLMDTAREAGFAACDAIPLEPDPLGADMVLRLCGSAGSDDSFAAEVAPLAVAAGAPYFQLLSRPDSSALTLLWLTKGVGPSLRSFAAASRPPAPPFRQPEAALGGMPPRWSIEATAQDTPEGIQITVDGWCLVNADVLWVRFVVDDVARVLTLGHPRPDVHHVMNKHGLYHPLNALCSGLRGTMVFNGTGAHDGQCAVRIEVALSNGLVVRSPVAQTLPMNETITLAQ